MPEHALILRDKKVILVGDRVLVKPERPDERTESGLYLPQTAMGKHPVQSGRVVAVGPGIPIPLGDPLDDEPWREKARREHYIPMQARVGDVALFLREPAVDVRIDGQEFIVVPQSAILVLIRSVAVEASEDEEDSQAGEEWL
jgi:chaperonin GroES